ncbi:MAG TPA: DUF1573 domain-containing protein [Leptolyngbyaceae cyanobacterium]
MKFKLLAISTFTLALPLGIWLSVNALSTPDIDVVSNYNLGTVVKGKVAVANLPLRNTGNAPLKVEAISTSCGCTSAKLSSMTISPGGQANLHIEYDSNAHESDRGTLERYVFISSNDPKDKDLQIKLSVLVEGKPTSMISKKVTLSIP